MFSGVCVFFFLKKWTKIIMRTIVEEQNHRRRWQISDDEEQCRVETAQPAIVLTLDRISHSVARIALAPYLHGHSLVTALAHSLVQTHRYFTANCTLLYTIALPICSSHYVNGIYLLYSYLIHLIIYICSLQYTTVLGPRQRQVLRSKIRPWELTRKS